MPTRGSSLLRGLFLACHPLPCLAVTAFSAGWALAVGLRPARVVVLAVAVLVGQLSIGWCNDAVDAGRDLSAGRRDKPVVTGLVAPRLLATAAVVALGACAVASFALGVRPGVVHVVAVLSAWSYDLVLKPTPLSPAPYAVSFGLLPSVATWAAVPPGWPLPGVVAGAALLGVAAHFANTVGDAASDAATGVRGLPQRLGPAGSLRVSAVLVALAGVALATAATRAGALPLGLLLAGVATAGTSAVVGAAMAERGRAAFRLTLAAVALVLAGFLLST